jgi:protein TonB
MNPKKSIKADLEWRKPLFFQIGLVLALLLVFVAFEFIGTKEKYENMVWGTGFLDEDIAVLYPVSFPPALSQSEQATDIEIITGKTEKTEDFTVDAESYEDLKIDNEIDTKEEMPAIESLTEGYPELHGGDENYIKLVRFLQENLIYPKSARDVGLEGQVYMGFTVEKNGRMTNFTILRGAVPVFDNEVSRVIKLMPKWKPKKNNDNYVRGYYQIPITFALE